MKIGILTFHRAENFGAVLQCYALQTYLESQEYSVKVIDYRCPAIEQTYDLFNLRLFFQRWNIFASFQVYINRLYQWKDRLNKKKGYISFRNKYLHLTKSIFNIKKDLGFDIYITGSDQVWNTSLLHGLNKVYFLDFPMSTNAKRISYAVSSETKAIDKLDQFGLYLKYALERFDSISVREDVLAEKLRKYTSKYIYTCIDPTFLISKDKYLQLAQKPKEKNYILVYHMAEIPEGTAIAEHIARKNGFSIIEIHARFANRKDNNRHKQNVGPLELLGYIAYANIIITTSFHGLALSLIFEKNFYVISKPNNLRLKSLLDKIGLENRLISSFDEIKNTCIDYKTTTKLIHKLSESSKQYIISSIKNENSILYT